MKLKILQSEFKKGGFCHNLVKRNDHAAIFLRCKDGVCHYEAVRIDQGPPHHLSTTDQEYDLVENYPSSEEWGYSGWTYKTLKEAETRFDTITPRATMAIAAAL